jgi:hypothetical protein
MRPRLENELRSLIEGKEARRRNVAGKEKRKNFFRNVTFLSGGSWVSKQKKIG